MYVIKELLLLVRKKQQKNGPSTQFQYVDDVLCVK